jgi:Fungal protein of unknown function (DUF1748)
MKGSFSFSFGLGKLTYWPVGFDRGHVWWGSPIGPAIGISFMRVGNVATLGDTEQGPCGGGSCEGRREAKDNQHHRCRQLQFSILHLLHCSSNWASLNLTMVVGWPSAPSHLCAWTDGSTQLGRLTHYAFDAILISAFLAGVKRSTGLT